MSKICTTSEESQVISSIKIDDTLYVRSNSFIKNEKSILPKSLSKPTTFVENGKSISLTKYFINKKIVSLTQPQHIQKFEKDFEDDIYPSEFILQRSRGAYIASICLPDLTVHFARCYEVLLPEKFAVKA